MLFVDFVQVACNHKCLHNLRIGVTSHQDIDFSPFSFLL